MSANQALLRESLFTVALPDAQRRCLQALTLLQSDDARGTSIFTLMEDQIVEIVDAYIARRFPECFRRISPQAFNGHMERAIRAGAPEDIAIQAFVEINEEAQENEVELQRDAFSLAGFGARLGARGEARSA